MSFKAVIPARYASTRLRGKPLLDIAGRPMIQWVIEAALASGAEEVLVATDDARIAAAATHPHTNASLAVLTRPDHASGTDRIAEVAAQRGWSADTLVVNVQGDEPQLPPTLVRQAAQLLEQHADAHIATLCTPIHTRDEFFDPNVVKVAIGAQGRALYFSRAPIPWDRDGAPQGPASQKSFRAAHRHLGIYAYRVAALMQVTSLPPSPLELLEKLEQLRALEAGMRLVVGVAHSPPPAGVDTPADLERVRAQLAARR